MYTHEIQIGNNNITQWRTALIILLLLLFERLLKQQYETGGWTAKDICVHAGVCGRD